MRYGYFDTDNDEYVIERPDVPVSWTNYLGVKDLCTVLSHNGGGYSFYKSSESGRVTRFRPNGVPLDRPGHYVYLRDDEDGDYWTISWQPVAKSLDEAKYETRHGLSYSTFRAQYKGIDATQRVFIPIDDDVELWDVTITNTSDVPRTISAFSYVEFSYHSVRIDNQNFQMSSYAAGADYADGIIEYDFYYEPWTYHYMASSETPDSFDAIRDSFLGSYRTEDNPIAVERGHGSNSQATTGNHCGSLQHKVTLQPGETKRLIFMLGYGSRDAAGRAMKAKYSDLETVDREFARLGQYWDDKQSVLKIDTPSEAMNTMINTWTLFQAETCVVWSRFASFVEVGGRVGLGYRDTAQDVMSVLHTNPNQTKRRILELLKGQTSQGYGLHLFDPLMFEEQPPEIAGVKLPTVVPTSKDDMIHGIEDVCSDDHLWLVTSVIEFVKETGDYGFLDEVIDYIDGPSATVYEHLKAALDFTDEHVGAHGIAEGLRADWNDCLNLGGGETALVTFMHVWAINALLEAAEHLGRADDVEKYNAMKAKVTRVANDELWDGDWYIRGYTRDGVKIGSAENKEGKIFLEAMPWAVISGIADEERATKSMDSVHKHLFSEYGLHLNWPAYTEVDDTIGYVTRVYPGVKENAAVFSHPNGWPIIAEAILGRGDRAMEYYDAINPYNQNDNIEVREAEPYSYVQFIYGRDHEYFGKARHPWLTGTAGWMYTAATKWILGVRLDFDGIVVDPCIPTDWKGFTVQRKWRGATYQIEVKNPDHVSKGIASITVDGVSVDPTSPLPVAEAGTTANVVVTLG